MPDFDEIIERRGTGAFKYDARGRVFGNDDVLPLWVADMDFRAPDCVIEALSSRLAHGLFGYPVRGDAFFSSIIGWMMHRHGWSVDRDWIAFSPGVVPALNICVQAFTNPGEGIIVQPPVYHLFFSAVRDHKRSLLYNSLVRDESGYRMNLGELESLMKNGAKMMILCSPHNPVGRVWSRDELASVAGLCRDYGVILVSDEIHSDLVFPGHTHVPVSSLVNSSSPGIITCISPSKTFNIAGLSTAAVIIPDPNLRTRYKSVLNAFHLGSGTIFGDTALEAAYSLGGPWLDELLEYLRINRDFAVDFINSNIRGMTAIKPEATYLLWIDCTGTKMDDAELRKFFIEKAGVGLSDGPIFGPGGNGYQRLNFACPRSVLEAALKRISRAAESF